MRTNLFLWGYKIANLLRLFNPFPLKGFCILKWFSGYTRPMDFRDSIFNVTINSTPKAQVYWKVYWNMVFLQFLASSQPFFILSSCLMSIIKLEGSSESTLSQKWVRCCTLLTNLAHCCRSSVILLARENHVNSHSLSRLECSQRGCSDSVMVITPDR